MLSCTILVHRFHGQNGLHLSAANAWTVELHSSAVRTIATSALRDVFEKYLELCRSESNGSALSAEFPRDVDTATLVLYRREIGTPYPARWWIGPPA